MILLADNLFAWAGFLLGMILLLSLLLRRSGRYFRRLKGGKIEGLVRIPRPSRAGRFVTNADSPDEIARFEAQLFETTREITAQLDAKMVALQVLLQQANAAIARLEELAPAIAESGSTRSASAAESEVEGAAGMVDEQTQRIFALADEGFSAVTIAHRAGISLREVEQLLATRKR